MAEIKIYYSNFSEYKEYKNAKGVKDAVKRFLSANPESVDVLTIIEGEQKKRYLKYNPWLDTERETYDGAICLVKPYKDGYMVAREFAVKIKYINA